VNEVRSMFRVVKLRTPPPEGCATQCLLVPTGATDQQVLEWAAECLDEASLAELREVIAAEQAGYQ
jgi:hypothetical protein